MPCCSRTTHALLQYIRGRHAPPAAAPRRSQDGVIGDFLPLIATRGNSGRHALVRSADDFLDIATDYEREQQQAAAAAPEPAPAKK